MMGFDLQKYNLLSFLIVGLCLVSKIPLLLIAENQTLQLNINCFCFKFQNSSSWATESFPRVCTFLTRESPAEGGREMCNHATKQEV